MDYLLENGKLIPSIYFPFFVFLEIMKFIKAEDLGDCSSLVEDGFLVNLKLVIIF